jgi:hypothetical protein
MIAFKTMLTVDPVGTIIRSEILRCVFLIVTTRTDRLRIPQLTTYFCGEGVVVPKVYIALMFALAFYELV